MVALGYVEQKPLWRSRINSKIIRVSEISDLKADERLAEVTVKAISAVAYKLQFES